MATLVANTIDRKRKVGTVVEPDREEYEFEKLVELWANDEISYERLQKNFPQYDASMIRKIWTFLLKVTDT